MRSIKTKLMALLVLVSITGLTQALTPLAFVSDNDRSPDLPSPLCDELRIDSDQRLAYRAFAIGVQRYRWDGTTWAFVEPVATLYSDAAYHDKVGIHYAGPTWEGNSGGKVVATKLKPCTPDATAIPWLKLGSVSNEGPGVFGSVSFIQRVNTKGGLAPTAPGSVVGTLVDIPYTAEYYFYRPRD